MSLDEFSEFGSIVEESSIINKTRFMIEKGEKELTEKDKFILTQAMKYFIKVINGYEFETTSKILTKNLKDSINAYENTKHALKAYEMDDFKALIKRIIIELKNWRDNEDFEKISERTKDNLRKIGKELLRKGLKCSRTITI